MAENLKPSRRYVQIFPLFVSAAILTFCALHHGSYSIADRQPLAVAVWLAVGLGVAFGLLPSVRMPRPAVHALVALLALGCWITIGLSWTESSERTFAEVARVFGYLGLLLLIWIGVGRHNWRMVAAGLLLAAVTVCCMALLSRLWPAGFPQAPLTGRLRPWRLSYPLGYWNAVGCWSAMTLTLCLAWASHARGTVVRALALAAFPVCIAVLYLTLSRAALGGLALGMLVVIGFARYRWYTALMAAIGLLAGAAVVLVTRRHSEIIYATGTDGAGQIALTLLAAAALCAVIAAVAGRSTLDERLVMSSRAAGVTLKAGLIVAALAVIALGAAFGDRAVDQFNTTHFAATATDDTRLVRFNGNRANLWRVAGDAFEAEPLHGIGSGTYGFWWNRNALNAETVRDVHNIYLEALAETGLPGLVLFLAFFGLLGYAVVRARSALRAPSDIGAHAGLAGVFAVFLLQAGVDWIWESTAVAVLALAAAAIAAAACSERRKRPEENLRVGLRVAFAALAAAAVLIQLPGLLSEHHLERSRADFRAKDFAAAASTAQKAIDAQPWAASTYAQRALALEAAGDYRGASAEIARAQEHEPTNWFWWLIEARIARAASDAAAQKRAVARARQLKRYPY